MRDFFDALLPFILTCTIIEITPGPNMVYLAILSASEGRKAGFMAVAGIAVGLLIIGLSAAMGVAALVSNSFLAYEAIRWSGVLYLLWLAWDGWKATPEEPSSHINIGFQNAKFFKRGLITNLLNPKAAIFYIALLPGFIKPDSSFLTQTLALTVVYVCIATIIHVSIVVLADSTRTFFRKPSQIMIVRRILSAVLAGVAVWFMFSTGT